MSQHWSANEEHEALEKLEFNFMARLRGLLDSYKPVAFDTSAFVNVDFCRPLVNPKEIIREMRQRLDKHLTEMHMARTYQVSEEVEIGFLPSSIKFDRPFCLGVQVDSDSGGFVVGNMCDSLRIIIREKEKKIAPIGAST